MALSRQKFREMVFQLLFSSEFVDLEEEEVCNLMMKQLSVTKKTVKEALAFLKAISSHFEEIDQIIRKFSKEYDLDRIAKVEKNILRLGIYELCFAKKEPPKVVITEAMRLSRKFATAESSLFINAVLDAIFHSDLVKKDQEGCACFTNTPS
jgi:transcription antitermination protein NusB